MWGLETYWRIPLGQKLDADVLVFHEHWLGLILTSPFLILGARALRTVSRKALVSMLGSGVLGSALGTVCFTQALSLLNSSLANLLLNVQPVISVLVSWVVAPGAAERARFYPWGRGGAGAVAAWRARLEPGRAPEVRTAWPSAWCSSPAPRFAGARRRRSDARP